MTCIAKTLDTRIVLNNEQRSIAFLAMLRKYSDDVLPKCLRVYAVHSG